MEKLHHTGLKHSKKMTQDVLLWSTTSS